MMEGMGEFSWGMGFFGWIFMLLFWGLVIAGTVALVRWLSNSSDQTGKFQPLETLEILKQRYAQGEINQDEFEQKKHELQTH